MPDTPSGGADRSETLQRRLDARERALGLLYEADLKSRAPDAVMAELPVEPDPLTVRLVTGVSEHRDEIDADLDRVSRGWSVDRMPVLDRAILRIGVFELRWAPDVPTPVVLNEAVELAKQFCADESPGFVNGVLARLAGDLRDARGSD